MVMRNLFLCVHGNTVLSKAHQIRKFEATETKGHVDGSPELQLNGQPSQGKAKIREVHVLVGLLMTVCASIVMVQQVSYQGGTLH